MEKLKKIISTTNILSIFSVFFYIFKIFKIKENKIICINYKGKGYGDNPKYIVNELLKQEKYEIVWIVNNISDKNFPSKVKLVKNYSIRYFYEMATAKIWIANMRMPSFVRKRKNQYYIQTWHGGVGMKKIEKDAEASLSKYYISCAKNDSKMIDVAISNCSYRTNLYKYSFWYNGEILECGCPRNDLFFSNESEKIVENIKKSYGISNNKKIILYAPTFRTKEFNYFSINFKEILKKMNIENNDYIFFIRLHPKLKNIEVPISDNIINVTKYEDIDELMLVSDILITDYSSLMFDYIYMNRPIYLYAPDFEYYVDERGFNIEYKKLPFSISYNSEELTKNIVNEDCKNYQKKLQKFIKELDVKDNGDASKKICERIEEVIDGKYKEKI